jgi:mannose-6-phosphate isomerase
MRPPRNLVKPTPTRIEPIFSPRIWGARSLAPLYPEKTNLQEPLGEAWLTGVDSKIATGPYTGRKLGEAWAEMNADWRGEQMAAVADFPLLVKFIFPTDQLSIQVHPDDAYASAHEKAAGGRGKTEMWHVVSAEGGARVLIGLDPKVDERSFREVLGRDTLENLFIHWRVQPGDTFFIPAGTPHTIGKDMVLCEIQQYSDLTYRVYDYRRLDAQGKPRELHIEKALDVIRFGLPIAGKASRIRLPARGFERVLLAACRYFATERWKNFKEIETQSDGAHFDLFVILTGSGHFVWPGGSAEYQRGECWLIPAELGKFALNSSEPSKVLRTYVPDLPAMRDRLERDGHSWQELEKTIFD